VTNGAVKTKKYVCLIDRFTMSLAVLMAITVRLMTLNYGKLSLFAIPVIALGTFITVYSILVYKVCILLLAKFLQLIA